MIGEPPNRAQDAKARLAQASTYIPRCSPWLAVRAAAGAWVYDINGSRYMDFGEGGRINLLGHSHPSIMASLQAQLYGEIYSGSPLNVAAHYPALYAKLLSERFPEVGEEPQQVLVCSSVVEARQVLSHLAPDAMFIRPVSPSGLLDGGLVQDLVPVARAQNQLVVANEIDSGFGRTGRFLGIDHFGIAPDVVMFGPNGAAGVPFAALVGPARLFRTDMELPPVLTSSLVCALAYGVLLNITDELLAHVAAMSTRLETVIGELVTQFPHHITGLTGVGLLRRLTLADPARAEKLWKGCRDQGLILGADLTLTPPLTVSDDEITAAADVLADVLLDWDTT